MTTLRPGCTVRKVESSFMGFGCLCNDAKSLVLIIIRTIMLH